MATATNEQLKQVALAYAAARKTYKAAAREAVEAVEPAARDDAFWTAIDRMAKRAAGAIGRNTDTTAQAVDGALWQILHDGGWSIEAWDKAAAFVRASTRRARRPTTSSSARASPRRGPSSQA